MKDLQDNTNMDKIKETMERFIKEVNLLQAQKRGRNENSEESFGFGKDVECESIYCKAKRVVKRFGTWLLRFLWS